MECRVQDYWLCGVILDKIFHGIEGLYRGI